MQTVLQTSSGNKGQATILSNYVNISELQNPDSSLKLGPLYEFGYCVAHLYCLMFSAGLDQNGSDDEVGRMMIFRKSFPNLVSRVSTDFFQKTL